VAFLETAALAFGVILLAEMGDKSQLVLITLALRGHPWALLAGAGVAFLLLATLAVAFAGIIVRFVPPVILAVLGGIVFLLFGIWTLLRRDEPATTAMAQAHLKQGAWGAFIGAFGLIFFAEMGDKTQLAILTLAAATGVPLAVGLGAVSAQLLLSALAILIGGWLSRVVPVHWVRIVSGAVFLIIGAILVFLGVQDLQASP
jgi:Ca2+/H+ antiporter, TMEM165/GDT1 family